MTRLLSRELWMRLTAPPESTPCVATSTTSFAPCSSSCRAAVVLVSANAELPAPPGVTVVPGNTALQLRDGVLSAGKAADVVVMAAAVADYRVKNPSKQKIKKGNSRGAIRNGRVVVLPRAAPPDGFFSARATYSVRATDGGNRTRLFPHLSLSPETSRPPKEYVFD